MLKLYKLVETHIKMQFTRSTFPKKQPYYNVDERNKEKMPKNEGQKSRGIRTKVSGESQLVIVRV